MPLPLFSTCSLLWLVTLTLEVSTAAKILAINPTASISHQRPFLIIMKELAERGHHVTVVTTDPLEDPPENFTQIDISFSYSYLGEINFFEESHMNPADSLRFLIPNMAKTCSAQLESQQMQQLLSQKLKFDAVIIETFWYWCHLGILHQLDYPPLIGFTSLPASPLVHLMVGNQLNPSYMPEHFGRFSDHMSFWQRLWNTVQTVRMLRSQEAIMAAQEDVMRSHFGSEPRSLFEMSYNFSLMLVCSHFSSSYSLPSPPNLVQLTGLQIQRERRPLPKDIQEFLDGAMSGVVYFSLGTNLKSTQMPKHKRDAFLKAFASLQQKVLLKWENDSTLDDLPDNVKTSKWLPQQDILAHPNVRLFITQGGLQSFNEAAYYAVPLLGIPFFGDQHLNVAKMVQAGIGAQLDFSEVTKESVLLNVRKILEDQRYQENMQRFSAVYREHQSQSLDHAVWWVEYVLRHRGAPHLRPASLDLRWWQLMLLDVIFTLVGVAAVVATVAYKLTAAILRRAVAILYQKSKRE